MIIPDGSQVIRIIFENIVPIDEIITLLKSTGLFKWAVGPNLCYQFIEPDDYYYENGEQWELDAINAQNAWDITTGSSNIDIAICDVWAAYGSDEIHPDLDGKVDRFETHYRWGNMYCGHGQQTSIKAASATNNEEGLASLGWNLRLRNFGTSSYDIENACDDTEVDIINCSFGFFENYWDFDDIEDAIERALSEEIIVVAAAGNDSSELGYLPRVVYPAAFNFGSTGQVIAVSGTYLTPSSDIEEFVPDWNYSLGNDPINDPTDSFIDVAAPGGVIRTAEEFDTGYMIANGTSLASPIVSALVGLMLSVNNDLTPVQVYDILRRTTDRIGQFSYNGNGWNRYMGYGRIDAANAVNVADGAPAKPRGMNISWSNNHPKIDWDAGEEQDLDHYEIYKKRGSDSYSYLASTNNTYYVDNNEYKYSIGGTKIYVNYKVKAVDSGDDESLFSDDVQAAVDDDYQAQKRIAENKSITDKPNHFKLSSNYPNPFNPTTLIEYQLPKSSHVTLIVYNMMGEEVSVLVNEYEEAGYYSILFSANDIPSGIYFYRLIADKFSDVKKMQLVK